MPREQGGRSVTYAGGQAGWEHIQVRDARQAVWRPRGTSPWRGRAQGSECLKSVWPAIAEYPSLGDIFSQFQRLGVQGQGPGICRGPMLCWNPAEGMTSEREGNPLRRAEPS